MLNISIDTNYPTGRLYSVTDLRDFLPGISNLLISHKHILNSFLGQSVLVSSSYSCMPGLPHSIPDLSESNSSLPKLLQRPPYVNSVLPISLQETSYARHLPKT